MPLNTKPQMVYFNEIKEDGGIPPTKGDVVHTPDAPPSDAPSEKEPFTVTTDSRLQEVETDKQAALDEVDKTYDGMIDSVDKKYQELSDSVEQVADKQAQLQQEQADLVIQQIEQQKVDAEKDYLKEQSAAYVDWQKQSAQHGVNAEQMAAAGMTGTGYSESSQVAMYNAYQVRVAAARESVNAAIVSYNNAMAEAKLQNSSALAEIALNAFQQKMELALEGFQNKNQLILEKVNQKAAVESNYYSRYLAMLDQINTEKALAEEQRQFDASLKEEQRQFDESQKASTGDENGLFIKDKDEADGDGHAVSTDYYRGEVNPDAKVYGTFSNGYQPKGISGHGKLKKSGEVFSMDTITLSGEERTVSQNVWQAEDGTLWYWQGRQNKYIEWPGYSI